MHQLGHGAISEFPSTQVLIHVKTNFVLGFLAVYIQCLCAFYRAQVVLVFLVVIAKVIAANGQIPIPVID